jgi:hypothetical protein
MRSAARAEYLRHYTADRNYQVLMNIYRRAACHEISVEGLREAVGVTQS